MPEGTSTATVVYTAAANDVQGGAVTYSLARRRCGGVQHQRGHGRGDVQRSPDFETKSAYSFNVVASDGTLTSSQAVTISVTDVAPSITSATSVSVPEGTATSTVVYTAAATDVRGGSGDLQPDGRRRGGVHDRRNTGAVTFNASPDFETKSSYVFNVVASDGTLTSSQAVTVAITDVAPAITSSDQRDGAGRHEHRDRGLHGRGERRAGRGGELQPDAAPMRPRSRINSSTGAVTFNASPNYEAKSSYSLRRRRFRRHADLVASRDGLGDRCRADDHERDAASRCPKAPAPPRRCTRPRRTMSRAAR